MEIVLPRTQKKVRISEYIVENKTSILNYNYVGVDAGTTHIGLARFNAIWNSFYMWEIEQEREIHTLDRIRCTNELLNRFVTLDDVIFLTIEGPSYADRYRQVELEDIRAACVCWAAEDSIVWVVPPLTIRKTVFGSGKIKNPWKEQGLPDNAAAALGCALYPIFKEGK